MTRHRLAALLVPVMLIGAVVATGRDRGTALGPVLAITPDQVIPDGFVGYVFHPDLSDRGEAAGVHDEEVNDQAFVHFDDGDAEPMQNGTAVAVSGDGCSSVVSFTRLRPVVIAVIVDHVFVLTNRCSGAVREFLTVPEGAFAGGSNRLALSHDGRFLAVELRPAGAAQIIARVDTAATNSFAAMPPILGEPDAEYGLDISDNGNIIVVTVSNGEQTEVAAWDVAAGSSALVSGDPAGGWSAYPSVSGDGRWAAFATSRRRGRVPGTGPWVYVTDRSNGAIRLASDASTAAYETSVSDDGTQVAYSANPAGCTYNVETLDDLEFDCIPSQINVSFGSTPGFAGPFSTEVISVNADGSVFGPHGNPVLSGNGRWVAWVSEVGRALMGSGDPRYDGRHAFLRRRDASLAVSNVNFGNVLAPGSANGASTVTNTGRSTFAIATISPSPGEFVITGGTCAPGLSLPPGGSCTVGLRFDANGDPATVNGALTVAEAGYDAVSGVGTLTGTRTTTTTTPGGVVTTAPPPVVVVTTPPPAVVTTTTTGGFVVTTGPPATLGTIPGTDELSATPDPVDFGDVPVLIAGDVRTVTVSNSGTADAFVVVQVSGDDAGDFELVGGSCRVGPARVGSFCTLDYRMTASESGVRSAVLTVSADDSSASVALTGIGRFEPRMAVSPRAVTERGITTIVGQGFPPGQPVVVRIDDRARTVTPGVDGMFRLPISPLGQLELGNHDVAVDDVPSLYDGPETTMVVVLSTFAPQGPTGPAFNNSVLVARS